MSKFSIDINTIMNADTSLNSYADGGIYCEHLPDSYSLEKTHLIFTYRRSEGINSIADKNLMLGYDLTVKIISNSTDTIFDASERLEDYLTIIDDGSIRDIQLINDQRAVDLEKNIYENVLEFNVLYQKE